MSVDQWYRTELDIGTFVIGLKRAGFDIILDIGINFSPISNIRHPKIHKSKQWLRSKALVCENKGLGFESYKYDKYSFDIGYWNGLRCRYRNSSDIRMTVFSLTFSSDIGITDVDVGCQISLTLRSMSMPTYVQWWASYFHKVTELLYFRYWWKKLATFNLLPTFYCNGSVTVTSYWYFKCNESVTSYYKM